MPLSPEVRAALDFDHLRILGIAYTIAGAATALFSCIFLLHFTMFLGLGLASLFGALPTPHTPGATNQQPPAILFLGFAAVIGLVILLGWAFGAAQIYAGHCLRLRQHLVFIHVIAALECLFLPWGTALGVFTFLVLSRPSVKALFKS